MKPAYDPRPLPTEGHALPAFLEASLEELAAQHHDGWVAARLDEGWTWGPSRDDARLHHPCLIPYDELPTTERDIDRRAVRHLLLGLLALGMNLTPGYEEGPPRPAASGRR